MCSGLPEVVYTRFLGRIDQRVQAESDFAIDALDLQHLCVQSLVMMRTQGNAVGGTGLAIARPVFNMVQFAPGGRPVAAGHSASTVAGQDGSTQRWSELALLSSNG